MLDNTLDYQSRVARSILNASPVFRIRLLTEVPSPHDLFVGGTHSYMKEYSVDIFPA